MSKRSSRDLANPTGGRSQHKARRSSIPESELYNPIDLDLLYDYDTCETAEVKVQVNEGFEERTTQTLQEEPSPDIDLVIVQYTRWLSTVAAWGADLLEEEEGLTRKESTGCVGIQPPPLREKLSWVQHPQPNDWRELYAQLLTCRSNPCSLLINIAHGLPQRVDRDILRTESEHGRGLSLELAGFRYLVDGPITIGRNGKYICNTFGVVADPYTARVQVLIIPLVKRRVLIVHLGSSNNTHVLQNTSRCCMGGEGGTGCRQMAALVASTSLPLTIRFSAQSLVLSEI